MRYLLFVLTLFLSLNGSAQDNGSVEGTVMDRYSRSITGQTVACFKSGQLAGRTITDINGEFILRPLSRTGRYDIAIQKGKQWYGIGNVEFQEYDVLKFNFVTSSLPEWSDSLKNPSRIEALKRLNEFNISIPTSI